MATTVRPFLMFQGHANQAMTFYCDLFPDAKVDRIERYGPEGPGKEGSVLSAEFTLQDQSFICIDSPIPHAFDFTPSFSIFVTCDTEAEVDRLFNALSEGGEVLMPLGSYPFAARFAWLADRFGVSWQLAFNRT